MDLDVLTPRQREVIMKVLDYRKTDSQTSLVQAYRKLGLQASTANAATRRLGFKGMREFLKNYYQDNNEPQVVTYKRPYTKKQSMKPQASGNAFILIVKSSDLVSTLNDLMKG